MTQQTTTADSEQEEPIDLVFEGGVSRATIF
jgi:hypothetical protein